MNGMIRYCLVGATVATFGVATNVYGMDYPHNQSLKENVSASSPSSLIIAQRGTDLKRGYSGDKGEKLVERLNLTTEQRNQMAQIRNKYQPQFNSLMEQIRNERNTLSEMMRSNQSQEQMRSQHQKIVALNQQIQNLRFESMLEMRQVLTPEQRQEWANMMGQGRMSRRGANR